MYHGTWPLQVQPGCPGLLDEKHVHRWQKTHHPSSVRIIFLQTMHNSGEQALQHMCRGFRQP